MAERAPGLLGSWWPPCRRTALLLTVGLLLWGAKLPAHGQPSSGRVGVGMHVGRPSGVLAKWYRPGNHAYTGSFSTDLDDRALVRVFRIRERILTDGSTLHRFLGPGVEFGMLPDQDARAPALGAAAVVGLNFYAERFEVVMRAVPHLRLLPTVDLRLGGSVGLRYAL